MIDVLRRHFNSKQIKMTESIYTKPKVCKSDKGWYVWFRYNKKLCRYKKGINRYKNLSERQLEANALCKALLRRLQNGWNPFIPDIASFQNSMTLPEALMFCLEKKKEKISPKSYSGYKGTVKFINTAIVSLQLNYISIHDVKRVHIRHIINKAKSIYNWSNKARNKNLNYLKAILSELIDWDIIENNPAHKIKDLVVEENNANITATPEEQKIIRNHLECNHFNFFIYVITIFHTGIRTWEACNIQIKNINFSTSEITLPAAITKTRKERTVPVNKHLMEHLLNIGSNHANQEYYLFGSFPYNHKHREKKGLDFTPGPNRLKRDTPNRRWKRIVKDGLGINVNLYAMKHGGADAKILAGIDLDSLRELYGHQSKLMTERYAKKVKEVYRKDIMDNSPEF